jgi:lipoprotein-releasing system permease protein
MHKSFVYLRTLKNINLKFEYFIALKNLKFTNNGKKISRPIIKLSIISISLAVIVNIITVSVVIGFKNEVSNKVLGFGSHAIVSSTNSTSLFENEPILKEQAFIQQTKKHSFVKNILPVAYKPAIFQSDKNNTKTQEIQSVLVKGVDENYDFSFFNNYLTAGRLPNYSKNKGINEILISRKIAQDLHFKVNDYANAFFVKNKPTRRKFKIVGIFDSGMEDFDKKIVIGNIKQIQELNDWGIKATIEVLDTLYENQLVIKANVSGGNGNFRYDWGKGYNNYSGFTILPNKDTLIRLIVSDYWMFIDGKGEKTSIPDTAYLQIHCSKNNDYSFSIKDNKIIKKYINQSGTKYSVNTSNDKIIFESFPGKGSFNKYVGAFEINFHSWDDFEKNIEKLKKTINFSFSDEQQDITVSSIKDNEKDIFVWLSFLDINVFIIITLMLIIGIINMGSALLVLILIRTSFIGLLMALGANNWVIRKIFLIQVFFLILRGLFWGNLIGLTLYFLQLNFGIIKLNPEVYYLNKVPVELNFIVLLAINLLTVVVCLLAMIIPSYAISKIKPSNAIKFN